MHPEETITFKQIIASLQREVKQFINNNEYESALEHSQKIAELSERVFLADNDIDNALSLAANFAELSAIYSKLNDFKNAIIYSERSLQLFEGSYTALSNQGLAHTKGALKIRYKIANASSFLAEQYQNQANYQDKQTDPSAFEASSQALYLITEKLYAQALGIYRQLDTTPSESQLRALYGFAYASETRKNYDTAKIKYQKALEMCEQIESTASTIISIKTKMHLADLQKLKGNNSAVSRYYTEAQQQATQLLKQLKLNLSHESEFSKNEKIYELLEIMAELHAKQGHIESALELHKQAYNIKHNIKEPPSMKVSVVQNAVTFSLWSSSQKHNDTLPFSYAPGINM